MTATPNEMTGHAEPRRGVDPDRGFRCCIRARAPSYAGREVVPQEYSWRSRSSAVASRSWRGPCSAGSVSCSRMRPICGSRRGRDAPLDLLSVDARLPRGGRDRPARAAGGLHRFQGARTEKTAESACESWSGPGGSRNTRLVVWWPNNAPVAKFWRELHPLVRTHAAVIAVHGERIGIARNEPGSVRAAVHWIQGAQRRVGGIRIVIEGIRQGAQIETRHNGFGVARQCTDVTLRHARIVEYSTQALTGDATHTLAARASCIPRCLARTYTVRNA